MIWKIIKWQSSSKTYNKLKQTEKKKVLVGKPIFRPKEGVGGEDVEGGKQEIIHLNSSKDLAHIYVIWIILKFLWGRQMLGISWVHVKQKRKKEKEKKKEKEALQSLVICKNLF